jgi:hypothetical protein
MGDGLPSASFVGTISEKLATGEEADQFDQGFGLRRTEWFEKKNFICFDHSTLSFGL